MAIDTNLFVGVDPSGGRNSFTYAVFDQTGRMVALDGGEMEEVLAFISGLPSAFISINAAQRPSMGLTRKEEVRQNLPPLRIAGRSLDMRMVEHLLRQHGINVSMTPSRKELCSSWVQSGFEFYRRIQLMGFQSFPAPGYTHQWLETNSHASFCTLIGQNPLPRTLLEGRLQRQLVLFEYGLKIRDPMDFFEEITRHKLLRGVLPLDQVYAAEELDAIAAALTAFIVCRHPDKALQIGDPNEGQITLPVTELKLKY